MICKYCGEKVNKIINYCGTCICMDSNARMRRWGKYNPKEILTNAEHRKRISWMHRETYLNDEDFYNDQNEPSGQIAPTSGSDPLLGKQQAN